MGMNTDHLEILEKTQLPTNQACAILEVMELELTAREGVLATKNDLKDAVLAMKTDLKEAVLAIRSDMRESAQTLRSEMTDSAQAIRSEMKDSAQTIRNEMKDGLHALDLRIERAETRLTRWVFTCVFGLGGLILGFMYLGLTHVRP